MMVDLMEMMEYWMVVQMALKMVEQKVYVMVESTVYSQKGSWKGFLRVYAMETQMAVLTDILKGHEEVENLVDVKVFW